MSQCLYVKMLIVKMLSVKMLNVLIQDVIIQDVIITKTIMPKHHRNKCYSAKMLKHLIVRMPKCSNDKMS